MGEIYKKCERCGDDTLKALIFNGLCSDCYKLLKKWNEINV